MTPQTFFFFGQVGAGKGTQVDLLVSFLKKTGGHVVLFQPGAEYRALKGEDSFLSTRITQTIEAGNLAPDFVTNTFASNRLRSDLTPNAHLIFDGYPRSSIQAQASLEMLSFYERENPKIIHLVVSEDAAVQRLMLRGRSDDTEEGIRERFRVFKESVTLAMNILVDAGFKFFEINGEQSIEDVHADIIKACKLEGN